MNTSSIGIVDDNPTALAQMRLLLRRAGFDDVRAYADPVEALEKISAAPPAALLVDYQMPGINGLQLLEELQRLGVVRYTPVALMSGSPDLDTVRLPALRAGAHEIIAKPLRPTEFALKLRNLMRIAAVPAPRPATPAGFEPFVARRVDAPPPAHGAAQGEVVRRLLERVARIRDEGSGDHTRRLAEYAAAIAGACGLGPDEQALLLAAAPLHDIGKIGVPDRILLKPGPLTAQERAVMQTHTTMGHELLLDGGSPVLRLGAEIALTHHERWDGQGYPAGLKGDAIPLSGRIVAVADAFDALTSRCPCREARPIEQAVAAIVKDSGVQFDPAVVAAFVRALGELERIHRRLTPRAPAAPAAPGSRH